MFVTGGGGGEDRGVGRGPRVAPSIPLRNESHRNGTEQPLGSTAPAPNGKHQRAENEKNASSKTARRTKEGRDRGESSGFELQTIIRGLSLPCRLIGANWRVCWCAISEVIILWIFMV